MSLDKAIAHGKEHRKPYRGAKAIDPTCRNHGSCEHCKSNRLHKFKKDEPVEDETQEVNKWPIKKSSVISQDMKDFTKLATKAR